MTLNDDRVQTFPILQQLVGLQVVLLVGVADVQVLGQLLKLLRVVLHSWTFHLLRREVLANRTTGLGLKLDLLSLHDGRIELLHHRLGMSLVGRDLGHLWVHHHFDHVGVGQYVQLAVLGNVT